VKEAELAAATPALLADIGGTNTRFALSSGSGRVDAVRIVGTADFDGVEQAIADYLAEAPERPNRAVLAVAGPVLAGRVSLTNADWDIDAGAVATTFGFARVDLVNDFAAVARSLPLLGAEGRQPIGGWEPEPRGTMVALGPGTGLGVAGLVPVGAAGWQAVPGEGGHVTLPATSDAEAAILAVLRRRIDHVSAERVLSGIGLPALDAAVAVVDGAPPTPDRQPEAVLAAARAGEARALRAVGLFVDLLATVAGDLALTFGATGGVFVAGGMPGYLGALFDHRRFRARFEAKGRSGTWLRRVPTAIVTHPQPGLLGLSALAADQSTSA
jgi:glucokinase